MKPILSAEIKFANWLIENSEGSYFINGMAQFEYRNFRGDPFLFDTEKMYEIYLIENPVNQSGKEDGDVVNERLSEAADLYDFVPGVPAEDGDSVASHSCTEGNSIEPFSCEIKITVHKSNRLKGMFDIDSSEYGFHYCDIYNTLEGLQHSLPKGKEWVEDRVKSYCRVLVTAAQGIDALLSQLPNPERSVATDDQ